MKENRNVTAIRKFSRFYTNLLGLLDQYILESKFSLSQVRVLHEIGTSDNCTPTKLSEILCLDAGYLSRILKQLEKAKVIERKSSPEDGRSYFLHMTDYGREVITALHSCSNTQINKLIEPLSKSQQSQLVQSMSVIENLLTSNKNTTLDDITIRHKLMSGDIGSLIHMHGWIYNKECHYPLAFEGYVSETFHQFMENYDEDKDRIWLAEHNGKIIGSIGIVKHADKAQLRWFLLDPDYRSIGLGKKLISKALNYCKQKKYFSVFLTTTEDQQQAISMYKKLGFVRTLEREIQTWENRLMEYTFELELDK
ncbi:bifunctional helix-turn-helix transcriptional regulator/GNAT family N-acetyltransferase [Zophobihabitans entericus]|uniref:GNAT family N-acetyltransferase n=1 Tax=Zophobihabitans entericus TaxID=1635327 RepID=A0A6G9IC45_9GAMM|nr:bifunctional helix-turn-helix transcriptional regulator/GNAT family N-acetyltransferase [Zophobihabitans entericus]QIQ21402.1 GNAT family N-acetyltransferase [Zophobihabitans entericus]